MPHMPQHMQLCGKAHCTHTRPALACTRLLRLDDLSYAASQAEQQVYLSEVAALCDLRELLVGLRAVLTPRKQSAGIRESRSRPP
jgi:hypothetical protein